EISEDDRPVRTDLLTRGPDLSVPDAPPFLLRADPGLDDPLDAVGALLHHPALPDGDVRVVPLLPLGRLVIGVLEEVEAADFVRAVVLAIPRADASIVDHLVQAL